MPTFQHVSYVSVNSQEALLRTEAGMSWKTQQQVIATEDYYTTTNKMALVDDY